MTVLQILTLLGSFGLLLYALMLLSESIQQITGDDQRRLLASLMGRHFGNYLSGGQLSVMLILLSGVGVTAVIWFLALAAFHFDGSLIALPIVALSLPLFNARGSLSNAWGTLLISVALLLSGIGLLRGVLMTDEGLSVLSAVACLTATASWGAVLLCVVVGIAMSALTRSAVIGYVAAAMLCSQQALPLSLGLAIIVGSCAGTCIVPLLLARHANAMTRRAALTQLLFCLLGICWVLPLFSLCCQGLSWLYTQLGIEDTALQLALGHTLYYIGCLVVCSVLGRWVQRLVCRAIADKQETEGSFRLLYIEGGSVSSSSDMALLQAQKEVSHYADETYRMFCLLTTMVDDKVNADRQQTTMEQISHMEEDSDEAELSIIQFISKLSPKTLSLTGEHRTDSLCKVVDELESIADSICHCAKSLQQQSEQLIRFNATMNADAHRMLALTDAALRHMTAMLSADEVPANALDKAYNYEDDINDLRNQLRNAMLDSIDRREIEYRQNTYFMQLINECEKVGDYVINVITCLTNT